MEKHKDVSSNMDIKHLNKKQAILILLISVVFIVMLAVIFSFFGKKNNAKRKTPISQKNNPGAIFSSVKNKDNTTDINARSFKVYENAEAEDKKTKKLPSVELDLTKLSGDFVYAEVNNMMTTPEKYDGKIVKIEDNRNKNVNNLVQDEKESEKIKEEMKQF